MKKILTIILIIVLFMPGEAFCLRPMSAKTAGEDLSLLEWDDEAFERTEISIRSVSGHALLDRLTHALVETVSTLSCVLIMRIEKKAPSLKDRNEIMLILREQWKKLELIQQEASYVYEAWSGKIEDNNILIPEKLYIFFSEKINELEESFILLERQLFIIQKQNPDILDFYDAKISAGAYLLASIREAISLLSLQRDFLMGKVDIEFFTISSFFKRLDNTFTSEDIVPREAEYIIPLSFIQPETDLSIYANSRLLRRVIGECYKNAEDQREGVTDINVQVSALLTEDEKHVIITVENDGPPISDDLLSRPDGKKQKIFDFSRSPRQGRHIGMPEAWHIVKLMGGTIEAENKNGYPRFTITLPGMRADTYPGISDEECEIGL